MKISLLFTGLVLAVFSLPSMSAQPAPSAREMHSAQCVAALDVNTQDLAVAVKAGHEESRSLLQTRLEAGAAFIGDTYLHEDRDEKRARALADAAAEDQKRLTKAQLEARQIACAEEGSKLLSNASGFERLVVRRLARKRMDKLLSQQPD
jgi:hypothetical protein